MARLTADKWADARSKWEADGALTFMALAESLGVSDAACRQKAKAENW